MSLLSTLSNRIKSFFSNKEPSDPVFDNVIIGRVVKAEKHPNADRLKVCTVDCGPSACSGQAQTVQIVCGGSNVEDNILVVVAKPGVKVYLGGGKELVELKQMAIRGVESAGMICGADELGLADRFPMKDEKEILNLSQYNLTVGMKLSDALKII